MTNCSWSKQEKVDNSGKIVIDVFQKFIKIYDEVYQRCKKHPVPNKEVAQREIEIYGNFVGQLRYMQQEILMKLEERTDNDDYRNITEGEKRG